MSFAATEMEREILILCQICQKKGTKTLGIPISLELTNDINETFTQKKLMHWKTDFVARLKEELVGRTEIWE